MTKSNNYRTDLISDKSLIMYNSNANVEVKTTKEKNNIYATILFPNNFEPKKLKIILTKQLKKFINRNTSKKDYHAFIVGIGNDSHTADSIGPKTLKHIKVNTQFNELGLKIEGIKVSTLEPGVLGETGIDTKRIIESVINEIKPDILIIIDAFVTKDIDKLNHTIEINDKGLTPGSGLKIFNTNINKKTIGIPVIVIGIPTAIEIKLENKIYFLSTNDIEIYVNDISKIIGESLNEIFYF